MGDDNVSKNSSVFEIADLFQQSEELGLRTRVPAQRKLTLGEQGLGLRMSTGTQDPEEKKEKQVVKVTPKFVKHRCRSMREHMKELKGSMERNCEKERNGEEADGITENKPDEIEDETPPFVVDLLTQEDPDADEETIGSTETIRVGIGGWENTRPTQWRCVFQARSTDGGANFFVDLGALGEVAA